MAIAARYGSSVYPARLDLGHGGSTFPDTGSAHVDARATAAEEAEERGGYEAAEGEVEEGSSSLSFAATAGSVIRTVGDVVAVGVALRWSVGPT